MAVAESEDVLEYRADVATLAAPITNDAGTVIFSVILATVGDKLRYSWGEEIATAKGLSDGVDDLVGLPVLIEDHPPINSGHVKNGDTGGRKVVGTIVGARFDAVSGERIAQLAVHDPKDQRRAKMLGSVSEAYRARTVDGEQVTRIPNSVVIAERGRAGSARLRADTKEPLLDETKVMEVLNAILSKLDAMTADKADADETVKVDEAVEAAQFKAKADADEAAALKEGEHADALKDIKEAAATEVAEAKADAIKRADTLATEIVALHKRANTAGIEIPETAKTADEIRTALATGLGADEETAKRADTAEAWIKSRESAPAQTERQRVNANHTGGGARADATPSEFPC